MREQSFPTAAAQNMKGLANAFPADLSFAHRPMQTATLRLFRKMAVC
jgi:hypothetical protein